MIVYEATKQLFVEDVVQDRIEENIDRKFYEKMGMKEVRIVNFDIGNGFIFTQKVLAIKN